MKLIRNIFVALAALLFSASLANAGEKWDMALAYGAGNFHSANATEFAKNVTEKSGGKLTIVTHPGGSLFKGGEISKADIQTEMDRLQAEYDALAYARAREISYPVTKEFIEAYTEKEIGGDTTKWDAYVVKYNKVRSDNQKP